MGGVEEGVSHGLGAMGMGKERWWVERRSGVLQIVQCIEGAEASSRDAMRGVRCMSVRTAEVSLRIKERKDLAVEAFTGTELTVGNEVCLVCGGEVYQHIIVCVLDGVMD